jgi:tetratricopeptide (TPR) repeat protein
LYEQVLEIGARRGDVRPAAVRLHRKVIETAAEIHWSISVEDYAQVTAAVEVSRAGLQAGMALPEHPAPDDETARLLAALSTYAWNVQSPPNWPAALQYARAAVEVAEHLPKPAALAAALGTLATAEFGNGQLRAYEAVAQRRLTLCLSEPFDDLGERLDALRDAGSARMYVGQYLRALEALTEAEALARQVHAVDQQFNALSLQSQCWFRLDKWDEMLRTETKWKGLDERYGGEQIGLTCFAVALGAIARARRGELETARARRQTSYALMLANTGPPEGWYRNQHY